MSTIPVLFLSHGERSDEMVLLKVTRTSSSNSELERNVTKNKKIKMVVPMEGDAHGTYGKKFSREGPIP